MQEIRTSENTTTALQPLRAHRDHQRLLVLVFNGLQCKEKTPSFYRSVGLGDNTPLDLQFIDSRNNLSLYLPTEKPSC